MKKSIWGCAIFILAFLTTSCNNNSRSNRFESDTDSLDYSCSVYSNSDCSLYTSSLDTRYYDTEIDEDNEYYDDDSYNGTINSLDGKTFYVSYDGNGRTTIHDLEGNYYYYDTDEFGNTTGHDLNGNFYYSHTDDFGNTTSYDLDGNYCYSHTDDFGNTSGYDLDGNYYSAYTDDFGNTTIITH